MKTGHQDFDLVHQIFVLDAYLGAPLDIDSREPLTRRFVDDTLSVLGLEPLGPLGIYPAVDERAPGWSFIQPITTSHLSAHYFEKPGRSPHIRIDAYSCERIDWLALLRVCDRHFGLADWHGTFIDREIDDHRRRAVRQLSGRGARVADEQTLRSASAACPPVVAA